jgi:hypothetical protein
LGVVAQQGFQRCDGCSCHSGTREPTKVPAPTRLSSTPRLASFCMASRSAVRETPSCSASARSVGSLRRLELGALDQLQQLLGNAVGQADGGMGSGRSFRWESSTETHKPAACR